MENKGISTFHRWQKKCMYESFKSASKKTKTKTKKPTKQKKKLYQVGTKGSTVEEDSVDGLRSFNCVGNISAWTLY